MEMQKKKQMKEVNIIHFEEKYAENFANLNYEWLNTYFIIEKHDREMLDNPQKYIIENQGQVLLAKIDNIIVGTVALLYIDENTYEVAKMAVKQGYKGRQIGKKLMLEAIEYAKKVGKSQLILESNTKLVSAINLYRKVGFKAIELDPNTPYERCDIRMKLVL